MNEIHFLLFQQADSGYGSENNLRRHGSMLSLASGTSLSQASASSFKVSALFYWSSSSSLSPLLPPPLCALPNDVDVKVSAPGVLDLVC